jgi:phosphatidylglycerophosphate synthase
MYFLQRHTAFVSPDNGILEPSMFLFVTPIGRVSLPLWIVLIVIGREAFMTLFRQVAARRGLIISAIGPAKWKTTFQSIWVGAAYFWFFAVTLAQREGWLETTAFRVFAHANGLVGVLAMTGAVALTIWSLWLYLQRYGKQVVRGMATAG